MHTFQLQRSIHKYPIRMHINSSSSSSNNKRQLHFIQFAHVFKANGVQLCLQSLLLLLLFGMLGAISVKSKNRHNERTNDRARALTHTHSESQYANVHGAHSKTKTLNCHSFGLDFGLHVHFFTLSIPAVFRCCC